MLLVKFVIGFSLFITAMVNHMVAYSEWHEIGDLLSYVTKRKILFFFTLGLLALLVQCVVGYGRMTGLLSIDTCRLLGFIALELVLLIMNLDLLMTSTKFALPKVKADTFYVVICLIAICLFFERISTAEPCVIVVFATMSFVVLVIVLIVLLMRYFSIANILVERINFERHVKVFVFSSMVFGLHGIASYCYPKIACWLALLGISSLFVAGLMLVWSIRRMC